MSANTASTVNLLSLLSPMAEDGAFDVDALDVQALDTLARDLDGLLVHPGDDGWDLARQAWNLSADQRPAAVAQVASVRDIVTVVQGAPLSACASPASRPATTGTGPGPGGSMCRRASSVVGVGRIVSITGDIGALVGALPSRGDQHPPVYI